MLFGGLDLGKSIHRTALVVLDRIVTSESDGKRQPEHSRTYPVLLARRWDGGTTYAELIADLLVMIETIPALVGMELGIDRGGVGEAFIDLLKERKPRCKIVPVYSTSGREVKGELGGLNVPKAALLGNVMKLVGKQQLLVSPDLPDGKLLLRELASIQVRESPSGGQTFEHNTEGGHADLAMGLALAAFLAERAPLPFFGSPFKSCGGQISPRDEAALAGRALGNALRQQFPRGGRT